MMPAADQNAFPAAPVSFVHRIVASHSVSLDNLMCVPPRNSKTEENISLLYLGEAFISMPHLPWILQEAFKSLLVW